MILHCLDSTVLVGQKAIGLFEILEVATKSIELIESIASNAATVAFAPSSLVSGAVSCQVIPASGISTSYDDIHELLDALKVNKCTVETEGPHWIATELYSSAPCLHSKGYIGRAERQVV
ncbi:hypothetical protein BDV97DRAFT_343494 [Delphinella strobiligena]|nr:hypothetical protein BDV97DRAFT_343494 [Delphinella strobiligena]